MPISLILITILAVLVAGTIFAAMKRYKKCPSDKVMVIFGKVGEGQNSRCIHGGAAFIWPVIQDYRFLDLTPLTIDIPLNNALSNQNIRVSVPSRFTIGISTDPSILSTAAERLLSMDRHTIESNASDIIFGQLRATIATMSIESINADRVKFESMVVENVETELLKIGLKLINVNIKDIDDDAGYIQALGKKAAAEAVEQAKVEVAEQHLAGETGQAEAQRTQRINLAAADATAVEGENKSKIAIANSEAEKREASAEAKRKGDAATSVKQAEAEAEGFKAQEEAFKALKTREEAKQQADIIVPAQIAKEKTIIEADADKEQKIREGEGEGGQIKARMEGEADGMEAILSKQAEGLERLVKAAGGNADQAVQFLIANQMVELMTIQVEAIKNIKIDKIVVWDSGKDSEGNTSTSNFINGMIKSMPPMNELLGMSGMKLPDWLPQEKTAEDIVEGKKAKEVQARLETQD